MSLAFLSGSRGVSDPLCLVTFSLGAQATGWPSALLPRGGDPLAPHGPLRSRGRAWKCGQVARFAEHLLLRPSWGLRSAPTGSGAQGGGGPGRRGAEPGAGTRPAVRLSVPFSPRAAGGAAPGRVRGGGGGSRAQERLDCARASAPPARAPARTRQPPFRGREAGRKAQAERARGWLSRDPFWGDLGLRPSAGSAGTARAGGRRGGPAARAGGSGSPGSAPAPAPGTHFVQDAPPSALWAGAGGPSERARPERRGRPAARGAPRPEPAGTFSARRGPGRALPGMRDCTRRGADSGTRAHTHR